MEILLLFAGALLGVVADRVWDALKDGWSRRRALTIRERALESSNPVAVSRWLEEYYSGDQLYRAKISGVTGVVPMFTCPEWLFSAALQHVQEYVRILPGHPATRPEVDLKLIERRRRRGQRLFDNPTFYVEKPLSPGVQVGVTSYFAVATRLIELEDEVFSAIEKGRGKTPVRDQYLPDADAALEYRRTPLSFGINAGFVIAGKSGRRLILQTRSRSTLTFGGATAVFPAFGLAPIGTIHDARELITLNFIKEYLEEFFDYEDLIDVLAQRRADPLWFKELPESREIQAAIRSGILRFRVLGLGMDALSGTTTLGILAELLDEDLGNSILRRIRGNWEVADPDSERATIWASDVYDPRLGQLLHEGSLHPSSAFTISRIQNHYWETEKRMGNASNREMLARIEAYVEGERARNPGQVLGTRRRPEPSGEAFGEFELLLDVQLVPTQNGLGAWKDLDDAEILEGVWTVVVQRESGEGA